MNRIQIRRVVSALTALAVVLIAGIAGAPAAFAQPNPPRGPWARPRHPVPFPPRAHAAAAASGMAGWQVALILVGAAIAGTAVVLISRARAARRGVPATAA